MQGLIEWLGLDLVKDCLSDVEPQPILYESGRDILREIGEDDTSRFSPMGAVDELTDAVEVVECSEIVEAIKLPSIPTADNTVSSKLVTGPLTFIICVFPIVLAEDCFLCSPVTLITVDEVWCNAELEPPGC